MKVASLLLLLVLVFPLGIVAQSPDVTTEQLKERAKTFRNHKRFSVEYDRFENITRVSVGPFRVKDGIGAGLSVEAWFKFEGQTLPKEITTVIIRVSTYGRRWMFLNDQRLFVIIDGERAELGDGERNSSISRGGVTERLYYALEFERFEQIAKGKSVEMRIASQEFALNNEHQEAFRNLLSLTTP